MTKNVVLDLDNTLIYSPEDITRVPKHCFHLRSHHVFIDGEFYLIFERPFLAEFLQQLRGKKIAIWTAAEKSYADFIVKHILEPYLYPDQQFAFVWHRAHCKQSEKDYKVPKHLDHLSKSRSDFQSAETILIDDNAELLVQNNNVYVIKAFTAECLDDTELLTVLRHL